MRRIIWNHVLSVDIPSIDAQHRHIVHSLNDLHDVLKRGGGPAQVRTIVKELLGSARAHFEHEETLMRRSEYPGYESHKAVHAQLIDRIRTITVEVSSGKVPLSLDVLDVLQKLLHDHITTVDRAYADHPSAQKIR